MLSHAYTKGIIWMKFKTVKKGKIKGFRGLVSKNIWDKPPTAVCQRIDPEIHTIWKKTVTKSELRVKRYDRSNILDKDTKHQAPRTVGGVWCVVRFCEERCLFRNLEDLEWKSRSESLARSSVLGWSWEFQHNLKTKVMRHQMVLHLAAHNND